jgi:segregation and condensation protein B
MPEEETQEDLETPDEAEASQEGEVLDNRLIVEGMLFSATKPLRIVDIEEATNLPRNAVRSALRRLSSDYRRRNTALEVTKVGGRWTMQVRSTFTPHARTVAAPEVDTKLLKTLALIAYHQPVLQSDLQEMLGPKVYEHVRSLVGLGLITAARRGATKQLTTTHKFPEYFGITSAKREDIKRFLAERVGIELLEIPDSSEEVSEATPDEVEGEQAEPVPGPEDVPPGPEDDQR